MVMTRKEYMASPAHGLNNRDAAAKLHREYYGQFVGDHTISQVVSFIGKAKLLASRDPHMNDIPLALWDRVSGCITLGMSFKAAEDYATLAGLVCVAKEAARQWLESQPKKEYYLKRSGSMIELRQTRFMGQDHPHDVCAVARDADEMRGMLVSVKIDIDSVNWSL